MQDFRQAQQHPRDFDPRADDAALPPGRSNAPPAGRPPIDLGILESEMRRRDAPQLNDPLRELARIVGTPRDPLVAAEPIRDDGPATTWDDDDHGERRHEGVSRGLGHAEPQHDAPPLAGPEHDVRAERPRGFIVAASLMGLVTAGAIGAYALTMKPPATPGGGAATVIAAKPGPTRERPADPGGVAVPDQNREIYEKASTDPRSPARVVTSEEQPVDLKSLPKRDVTKVVLPPLSQPAATTATLAQPARVGDMAALAAASAVATSPGAPSGAGEPRRVKSVAVRANESGEIVAVPPPRPNGEGAKPAARPQVSSPPPARSPEARPAAAKSPDKSPERVLASREAAPEAGAGAPLNLTPTSRIPRPTPAKATVVSEGSAKEAGVPEGSGTFGVQLSSRPSEADARAEFARLQRKHPELASLSPSVRKAEVNDKTVYRLRVGGLTQAAANELCVGLKAAGGSCFISR